MEQKRQQKKKPTEEGTTITRATPLQESVANLVHAVHCKKYTFNCFWNEEAFQRVAPGILEHFPFETRRYIEKVIGTDDETKEMKILIRRLKERLPENQWALLMSDLHDLFKYFK